ncbi:60S acidic ribosomal protein P0, putative [Entamoeba invadens IP1]|uniref:60S acidic ribosomal protein P0 n=2 Tax=Entamoeba invadens TaxID=33085 RepID=A0A0A1U455_ENTIV|nr:60S acidic ribosomal protein P0, putative [Entamoeba invadens IP1]ELP89007.1 60S acidic ribosomal protein P0, putative [Entamoeba invadens IP1]BAN41010.1 60S acidic ribosomal protein P0, putative [Entamoeba invadens]BAN41627.1 60S acidic ribosomal protein P0, putative [Entamoeba invadens]BAN42261.1 60S acidic ribosomal protein P0, putative [Entamoeba invadens]|eukprot:XP_004255778.1 60S acidic ribosomal protein P0, putative [Entamoeba invadens IP1]
MAPHKAGLSKEQKKQKKSDYLAKMKKYFDEYKEIVIVRVDNVGSSQFQIIRKELRSTCEFVMGKNTLIRKAIKMEMEAHPELELLLEHIKGNVGFIFTKGDLHALKDKLAELKSPSPAKAGIIAPNDVIVPAGDTGLDPTQTSFIQALNIQSKITKGQIEIIGNTLLIKEGEKVGVSQAVLLQKLKINPFRYGAVIDTIYDNGVVYGASALNYSDADLVKTFQQGVQAVTSVSLAANIPTEAACPHIMLNAFQALLGFSKATGVKFPLADKIFENMSSAPVAVAAVAASGATEEKKEEVQEEKKEEAEEDFGGFGDLF